MEIAGTAVVDSVAGKITDYTVQPILRQVGYLIHYKSNIGNLRNQVNKLKEAREHVQHTVDMAKRNGEEIESMVENWFSRVDEIVIEVDKFFDTESQTQSSCSSWSCPNLRSLHQLSRKATKVVQEVDKILGEGKFDKVSYLVPLEGVGNGNIEGYEDFESRMKISKGIMEALADANTSMIGVHGMGGVGKTMLVKEVARQARESKLFDTVVMATVTQTANIKRIQKEIADMLGLKFEEKSEAGRASRLRKRLEMEKRILVLLDDIWEKLDLEAVGIPSGNNRNGCKILMTSRNETVLDKMGTQKISKLGVLSKEEARNFFNKMAGQLTETLEWKDVATEVADECAGLPIALATVAMALKGKSLPIWRDAKQQLKYPSQPDNNGITKDQYSSLKLSYEFIEREEARSLILLCSLFPEDYQINIKYLLMYAMGMGLLNEVSSLKEARDRILSLVQDLKASCLLLDGINDDFVKMHDIVRDVAVLIASQNKSKYMVRYGAEQNPRLKIDTSEDYTAISLGCVDYYELPKELTSPHLKFLLLVGSRSRSPLKIPETFFEGMKKLKVLDLTSVSISQLPSSIRYLKNLQTLCLDDSDLPDMTIIGELKKLEILSLRASSIKELPGVIAELTSLKMLNLSDCSELKVIPSNLISRLTELAELYMDNSFLQWNVGPTNERGNAGIAELNNLSQLSTLHVHIPDPKILPKASLFTGLSSYRIFIGDGWEWSGKYETSRTLKLKLDRIFQKEDALHALLENAEDLHLDEVRGLKYILSGLNQEGFPRLKHLRIQNNAEIVSIINSIGLSRLPCFPVLESIFLKRLMSLELTCHGRLPEGSFHNLKKVKVESCDRLKFVFQSSVARGLLELEQLDMSKCDIMETVVAKGVGKEIGPSVDILVFPELRSIILQHLPKLMGFYSYEETELSTTATSSRIILATQHGFHPLFNQEVSFPKLETLKLSALNLGKIWHNRFSANMLTSLIVEDCGSIKYLFPVSVAKCLKHLKRLEIRNCHMMKDMLIQDDRDDNDLARPISSQEVIILPYLKTVVISGMDSLETLWGSEVGLGSFVKLKLLNISSCKKLLIIVPHYMINKVTSLETLIVTQCDSLEEIFQLQGLDVNERRAVEANHLRQLKLHRLPKLKHIWSKDPSGSLSYPHLLLVQAIHCQSLKNVFPASIAKSLLQLEELKVQFCGVEEIVAKGVEADVTWNLGKITSLSLWNLFELEYFYPRQHTLDFPSLSMLDVRYCSKLKTTIISSKDLGTESKSEVESVASDIPISTNVVLSEENDMPQPSVDDIVSVRVGAQLSELKAQLAALVGDHSKIMEELAKVASMASAAYDRVNEIHEEVANISRTSGNSVAE